MKKLYFFLICAVLIAPAAVFGRSASSITRGGLGFLFPDNNAFTNPGQFAKGHGFAAEVGYLRVDKSDVQVAQTSAVYGSGMIGIGAFGSRAGTNLTTPALDTDTAGAGLGLSMAKGRLTLGVGYQSVISTGAPDKGTLSTSLNLNPQGMKGLAVGVKATTNIKPTSGRTTQTGTVAIGYQFRMNSAIEAFGTVNDFGNAKDDQAGVAFLWGNQSVYFGAAGAWNRLPNNYEVTGRLGVVLANVVDISAYGQKVLVTGSNIVYGGSVRAIF